MERFVLSLVAGGCALVAGLWLVELSTWATPPSLAGVGLAVAGVLALGAGIWSQIDI